MRDLQKLVTATLGEVVHATIEEESCPVWLLRPGRAECAAAWQTVSRIYAQLTDLVLPVQAPPRERRRLDIVLTYPDGRRQIVEVDERQHFTAARATTLEHYPPGTPLGFDAADWLTRSRELSGREPGGGFAKPRPPLFPGPGGRHRQRAFRDALADLLPPEHGWLATVRISDREITGAIATADPAAALKALIASRVPPP
jgi:hypothetical protein